MSNAKIRICIIENGKTPDDLIVPFGSYPDMIARWLSPALPQAEFTYISAVGGETLPNAEDFDGYILSGSKYSTYERTSWMLEEIALLQDLRSKRIPVFGICFGHQLMADAYGGLTAKSPKGWGVGAQIYRYETASLPRHHSSYVFHQDQVEKTPPQARLIGGSSHCANGAFEYEFPAISVQFHPEFSADYINALANKFAGNLLSEPVSAYALRSTYEISVDSSPVAQWVAKFFEKNSKKTTSNALENSFIT